MMSEGYGFIEFSSHEAAARVLQQFNGKTVPQTDQVFRLNWAAFGVGKSGSQGWARLLLCHSQHTVPGVRASTSVSTPHPFSVVAADYSVFVGDLAPEVTDFALQEHFRKSYPSVRSAKVRFPPRRLHVRHEVFQHTLCSGLETMCVPHPQVITDPVTGRHKSYGFVRFGSLEERDKALSEMNGQNLCGRPIRVSVATAKKTMSHGGGGGSGESASSSSSSSSTHQHDHEPTNTTLFIGGLSEETTENELHRIFSKYGEVVYTKIPQVRSPPFLSVLHGTLAVYELDVLKQRPGVQGKGCGFVQFVQRQGAVAAKNALHSQPIGKSTVRISWGRQQPQRFLPLLLVECVFC